MAERVPRLVANVDFRKLKLDPTDGFLLTRIDGRLATRDLSRETGIPEFSIERALEKLEKLGVIERFDPDAPPPPPPPPPESARSALPHFTSILEAKYDPKELEEACDVPLEHRRRVLDMFYRLDDLDHYTLLGVTRDADKKTIKRAYFELASVMHPDRYFNKNVGSFKGKMEILFARVTEAHDALVDKEKRVEYDAYLDEVATTRGMEAMLERALDEAARITAAPSPSMVPGRASSPAMPSVVPTPPAFPVASVPPAPTAAAGPSPADLQARREALARRLLGGTARPPSTIARPAPSAAPPPNPFRYETATDAVDALKRRYEERVDQANAAQIRRYTDAAEQALAKNDLANASSALSLAVKYAPNDVALAMRYQEIKNKADLLLTESYMKQATYEERSQRWQEAARSWGRVAKLKPDDALVQDRAAHCLLQAGGDMHQAAEHAKQAVLLEPGVAGYHVTLAEVFAKAGLAASARRAAEAGLALDAKNAALLALVKRTGKP
jgi:hypothetical protein